MLPTHIVTSSFPKVFGLFSLSLGFLKQAFSFRQSSDTETSNFLLLAQVSWWDPDFSNYC